jgi:hypothetical protein
VTVRYGRLPYAVADALERGELSLSGFAILAFVECRANHKLQPPEAVYSLTGLADALEWPWTIEKLRQDLHALKRDGWIDFESSAGKRSKYVLQLKRASLVGGSLEVEGPPLEVKTDANPLQESDSERSDFYGFGGAPKQQYPIPNTQHPKREKLIDEGQKLDPVAELAKLRDLQRRNAKSSLDGGEA